MDLRKFGGLLGCSKPRAGTTSSRCECKTYMLAQILHLIHRFSETKARDVARGGIDLDAWLVESLSFAVCAEMN